MAGVTTAILAFIFVCIIFPHLVRHRTQFHLALAAVVAIILLDSIAWMIYADTARGGFKAFAYAMTGLLQIVAILALFFSTGGVTPREVVGEMKQAIEVMRRGEEEKEIIIPIGDQKRTPQREAHAGEQRMVHTIKDEPEPAESPPAEGTAPGRQGPLPLE